jgi:hypothetical protein
MAGFTDAGLEIPTLDDLNQGMENDIHGNVSPSLNLTSRSAVGEYKGVTASQLRVLWEALQALEAGLDPAQATGVELDRLGRLVGSYRRGATKSTVRMTLVLAAGTYTAGTLVVSKVGDPTVRFENVASVTTAGGTVTNVSFIAQDAGPLSAPLGSLIVIANPVTGFIGATNPSDALVGALQESNAAFRRRRDLELARKGSTTVDAIRADLLELSLDNGEPMFDYVSVVENDTDFVVNGRDPHSFETLVVTAADDAAIAAAILAAKPAGIKAFGTDTAVAYDSQNNPHTVGWTIPDDVPVYMWVYVDAIAGQFGGVTAVQDAILERAVLNQSVGQDVIRMGYAGEVVELPGVVDITAFKLNNVNNEGTSVQVNWVIGTREIARLDRTRINVNVNYVAGAP